MRLLYPVAPHIAEELWSMLGERESLVDLGWMEWTEEYTQSDEINVVIQVNGKVRGQIQMDPDSDREQMEKAALENEKVISFIEGREIRKIIVVPKKLVNIVV